MSKTAVHAPAGKKGPGFSKFGSQKFIVFLVVIILFVFFSIFSANFRKYTKFISKIKNYYYICII